VAYRVLLVEDDPQIRQVLNFVLTDHSFLVTEAATGEEGVQRFADNEFDIAIIDLRLPVMSGFDVVRTLRVQTTIPLVILTAHGDSHDVVAGLEAGADDFLSKPIGTKELVARLQAILRRVSGTQPTPAQAPVNFSVGPIAISSSTHEAFANGIPLALTRTEFGVLCELAKRSPAAVSKQELLEIVWGYDYLGDSRLVDMQIYRLRQKLDNYTLRDAIVTIRGVGFKLVS